MIPVTIVDAWDLFGAGTADALCITTNGAVRKDGACVMGRGIAKQAKTLYPGLDLVLGARIQVRGNVVSTLRQTVHGVLVAFPVKHHWSEHADLELIRRSARQLMDLITDHGWQNVILPKPGCGNGQLWWEDVEKVLKPIIDERVIVVDLP